MVRLSPTDLVDAAYTKNQAWKSKADTLGEEPGESGKALSYFHRWAWGRELGRGISQILAGGGGFWTPRGGGKFCLSEGGKGGE